MKQLIIACVLILLVVVFAVQNSDPVAVKFISGEMDISLALLMIITLVTGVLTGLLCITPKLIRDKKEIALLKKQSSGAAVSKSTSGL